MFGIVTYASMCRRISKPVWMASCALVGKKGLPPRPPVNDTAVSTMTFAYVEAGTSSFP